MLLEYGSQFTYAFIKILEFEPRFRFKLPDIVTAMKKKLQPVYRGIVERGAKRAEELGFPTMNIPLVDSRVSGIYAARVRVPKMTYMAAAFADPTRKLLEAHLLDFPAQGGSSLEKSGTLYGTEITIELCKKIRDSRRFTDDKSLREAIADDVAKVREYFKN